MATEFKDIEFTCTFKMQIKVPDHAASKEEIVDQIEESFEFVTEYGSSACDYTDDYSAYMTFDNIQDIKIVEECK